MTRAGKLPGFSQRRIDALIARKKRETLPRNEERELAEALDYIDAKSISLLHQYAKRRTAGH